MEHTGEQQRCRADRDHQQRELYVAAHRFAFRGRESAGVASGDTPRRPPHAEQGYGCVQRDGEKFMHGRITANEWRSTRSTTETGSESTATPESESDRDAWFYNVAQDLLGKDAGLGLHVLTGYPQSTCYAYVAKNPEKRRPPPEHLLWKLFNRDDGEPWHDAFMHGCTAKWWKRRQSERRLAALARSIFSQLDAAIN